MPFLGTQNYIYRVYLTAPGSNPVTPPDSGSWAQLASLSASSQPSTTNALGNYNLNHLRPAGEEIVLNIASAVLGCNN